MKYCLLIFIAGKSILFSFLRRSYLIIDCHLTSVWSGLSGWCPTDMYRSLTKIYFNIIMLLKVRSPKWSLSVVLFEKLRVISCFPNTCDMTRPHRNSPRLGHPDNITRRVQCLKFLIMQFLSFILLLPALYSNNLLSILFSFYVHNKTNYIDFT